jgi:hypothetical protein
MEIERMMIYHKMNYINMHLTHDYGKKIPENRDDVSPVAVVVVVVVMN